MLKILVWPSSRYNRTSKKSAFCWAFRFLRGACWGEHPEGRDSRNQFYPAKSMPRPGRATAPASRAPSRRNPRGIDAPRSPQTPLIHRTFLRTYATVAELSLPHDLLAGRALASDVLLGTLRRGLSAETLATLSRIPSTDVDRMLVPCPGYRPLPRGFAARSSPLRQRSVAQKNPRGRPRAPRCCERFGCVESPAPKWPLRHGRC